MKKLSLFTAFLVAMLLNVQSQSSQNAIWSLPPNYAKWIGGALQPSIPLPIPIIGAGGSGIARKKWTKNCKSLSRIF